MASTCLLEASCDPWGNGDHENHIETNRYPSESLLLVVATLIRTTSNAIGHRGPITTKRTELSIISPSTN